MVVFGQAALLWHLTWPLDEGMNQDNPDKEYDIEAKNIMIPIERLQMTIKPVAYYFPLRLSLPSCERPAEPSCECIQRPSLLVDELS